MNAPPPLVAVPPLLEPTPQSKSSRRPLTLLLSLCVGLFLADAAISLLDDTLILLLGVRILTVIRGVVFLLALLFALVIYGLMGLTLMIPKRLFLPVTLFNPVAMLGVVPVAIYFDSRVEQVSWIISFCQVIVGLGILYRLQGGFALRWPLVAEHHLSARGFSGRNLLVFALVNAVVLPPVAIGYAVVCAALAIDRFSDGFVALRPSGLKVQARRYTRPDGKMVQLIPMAHVAEADFYRKLSQSFPSNSIILMEGVTDRGRLLTNRLSYKRSARALGLAEQGKEFNPTQCKLVMADVDTGQFATTTVGVLNLVTLIHARGLNGETVRMMIQHAPPLDTQQQLLDDLLTLRTRHLLQNLRTRLPQSENFIVPWGAAHMPGIAREIQELGFRLDETEEHTLIRFRSAGQKSKGAGKEEALGEAK